MDSTRIPGLFAASSDCTTIHRFGGIDVLRIAAMVLVTVQHALTLTGHQDWSTFRSLNIGQLGVAIFLALSGLLSSMSRRRPLSWLAQRLGRLYPSYWLAMIGCFVAARITNYKQFDFYQVVSQMLGTGLFTHSSNLINVPTWFISLILVCYFGLFVVRLSHWPRLANLLVVASIILWLASSGFRWPWIHLMSFFAASALVDVFPEGRRSQGFLAVGVGFLLFAPWSNAFAYSGIALLSIGIAMNRPALPRLVTRIADHCYEYYLIHGAALILATSTLRDSPLIAVACGILLAASGAILLKRLSEWVVSLCVSHSSEFRRLCALMSSSVKSAPSTGNGRSGLLDQDQD